MIPVCIDIETRPAFVPPEEMQELAVPGGWLYLVWPETGDAPVMCFVPDPSAGQGEGK